MTTLNGPKQSVQSPAQLRGFTLIETLIALFILTTALLGFASLSAQALQATRGAIYHDLATLQAIDLAERIRANPVAAASGSYLTLPPNPGASDCTQHYCDPTMMAKFDLHEWNQINATRLPSGEGSIRESAGDYLITIEWLDGATASSYALQVPPP